MKKIFIVFTSLVVIFIILFLTGAVDYNNTVKQTILEGNRLYNKELYDEALASYQKGLQKDPDNPKLNYNAGQALYMIKDYQQAADYYGKALGSAYSFLNCGNSCFKMGESAEDPNQMLQYFSKALETYKQGIQKFPENVELKFNYEYVAEKIKELSDNINQDQQQKEEQDKNGEEENQQNNQHNNQDSEESREEQQIDHNSSTEDNEQQNSDENEKQEPTGSEKGNEQDESESEKSVNDKETGNEPSGLNKPEDSKDSQENSQIQQVLDMLEKQEEQALKNNQKVKDHGKENGNDW